MVVIGFRHIQMSLNHFDTANTGAKIIISRKKLALLRRILQRCESTSDMYSTTSFRSGGSARPSRAATIWTAWWRNMSSCMTLNGRT
ncbi:hypothetical protein HanRHA438_Chr13g0587351 [Helianthus annuus]|nr:hypothetical protein HanIR_Chr13g0627481 [Helianthus annuus]KAJ0857207.1 hypothetical protein HanRHA438_Chr13g0587351 [Helianthus annuus]